MAPNNREWGFIRNFKQPVQEGTAEEKQIPIKDKVIEKIRKSTQHKFTLFSLYGSQLRVLPPEINELQFVEWLDLGTNYLTSLPPEIGQLTNLRILDLSNNRLTSLAPEIGNLQQLITLKAGKDHLGNSSNQIKSFPPEICKLSKLHFLDLSGNADSSPKCNFAGSQKR